MLFRSVAEVFGAKALGVVLTGMGSDGQIGASAMVQRGAEIIAQDEESSVVWGMPGAVCKAGLASEVLPLSGVARAVTERVQRLQRPMPLSRPANAGAAAMPQRPATPQPARRAAPPRPTTPAVSR